MTSLRPVWKCSAFFFCLFVLVYPHFWVIFLSLFSSFLISLLFLPIYYIFPFSVWQFWPIFCYFVNFLFFWILPCFDLLGYLFTPVSLYNGILFWKIFYIRIYVNFFLIIVTNHGVNDESAHHLLMIKEFYISIFFLISLLGVCALCEVIYVICYIFSNMIVHILYKQ